VTLEIAFEHLDAVPGVYLEIEANMTMTCLKYFIPTLCLLQIISNLGLVIFCALDYGFTDEEERNISTDLEALLDSMVSAGQCSLPY
jgi:hypothetical protein